MEEVREMIEHTEEFLSRNHKWQQIFIEIPRIKNMAKNFKKDDEYLCSRNSSLIQSDLFKDKTLIEIQTFPHLNLNKIGK